MIEYVERATFQATATRALANGETANAKVNIARNYDLGEGAEGTVYLAHVALAGADERVVPLAYKELYEPESAPYLLERYGRLRMAGLPVPQTFRITTGERGQIGVLMTDQTAGNTNLLIEPGDESLREAIKERPSIGRRIQEIELGDYTESGDRAKLAMQLRGYAAQAAANGVLLSSDSPRLILHPDDSFDVEFSDMGFVAAGTKSGDAFEFEIKGPGSWNVSYMDMSMSAVELEAKNLEELNAFRNEMKIYQWLAGQNREPMGV